LVKLGHEVHVLAGATDSSQIRLREHDGVKVFRFLLTGSLIRWLKQLGKYRLWWTKNRLENGFSMYNGFKAIKLEHEYDLIEMPECGAEGLLINNLIHQKTLIKFHSPARLIMPFYNLRQTDIRLCSFLEQLGIRGATVLSSCSQFLADEVKVKLKLCGLPIQQPIRVIPNGIDLDLFDGIKQIDIRRKFDLPKDRLIIFFSGRMEHRKGIHLCKNIVVSILERYPVTFVFAGQDLFNYMADELLPYLKTKKLKGSIHYLGKLNHTDIHSCLGQSDIFLIPSLWENCPYSCLEAMAAGLAVVSSDQGGMPEIIRDGVNGLLAHNKDVASFISKLEELIEDNSLRERLGTAARKTIKESFTDIQIARLSADYYKECINNI